MKNIPIVILHLLVIGILLTGCKKLIEIEGPTTSISSEDVFKTDATAIGVLTNLYAKMSSSDVVGGNEMPSLSCRPGLSADELTLFDNAFNADLSAFYRNEQTIMQGGGGYWMDGYEKIYIVNSAIEGLAVTDVLTPEVNKQLMGEAKFMRAFYYFYLVNLFGDVPLVLGTDYYVNERVTRSSKEIIYQQIVVDLKEAQSLLSDDYLKGDLSPYPNGSEERLRPTRWAATALLARTYLYMNDWANAEAQSSIVLQNIARFQMESIDQAFLKNNKEAIWQLQPIIFGNNTREAGGFILPASGPSSSYPVYLSNGLMNSFETGDERKIKWVNSVTNGITYFYPYKYKVPPSNDYSTPVTEYSTVFRLAEQFLIRAEARANSGNLEDAIGDVDEIRKRAGLPLIKDNNPGINQADLLDVILKERRVELFTEWGHRWLDLKRTGRVDEVMTIITPQKSNGGIWKSYQQLYPIYKIELERNPNLNQTPGY